MKPVATITFCICLFFSSVHAQHKDRDLTQIILFNDSIFWAAYNSCDIETMQKFISDDVEFYHDKSGITLGRESLMTNTRKNLCGNENTRLKRTAIPESVKVFPLENNGVLYGAIISGEHFFYVLEKGKAERLDGLAKFTHVWTLQNNDWKMSRILSYGHGPAPTANNRKEIKLSEDILNRYAGQYQTKQFGICDVKNGNDGLNLLIGDQKFVLYPFSSDHFFVKDRDLTFEFAQNEEGVISRMIVRENGNIVEEAARQ